MEIKNVSLSQYIDRLKNNKYFSFVRYGDGEWNALFGVRGMAGRAQKLSLAFHEDMKKALLEGSKFTGVFFGIQRYALGRMRNGIKVFLIKNSLNISWVDADVFHRASRDGSAFPLIKILREKKMVIVGPDFLKHLSKQTLPHTRFVEIPSKNSYGRKDEILKAILTMNKEIGNDVVYSFSSGPSAEVFILNLHKRMPQNFFIDFGSFWDIFVGRRTRGYMYKHCYTNEKLKRNLGIK